MRIDIRTHKIKNCRGLSINKHCLLVKEVKTTKNIYISCSGLSRVGEVGGGGDDEECWKSR